MEKPKPTQNLEQEQRKTPEDYVVATFPVDTDPDNARRPLTVIRSGQDGEGVKYDRGWNPIGMSVVCDTDSEEGIGPIKLLMEAYKLVGTDIKTEFVPLEDIQGLNEDYIKYLYGKTPKEMIEEAKQIWRQKHPDSMRIESLAPGVGSDSGAETPSNGLVEDNTSDHEKPLVDEVSPAMGGVAVEATGIKKPITNKVEINEPVRGPVKTNETGVGSPALRMTKEVLESIGAIKVNDSVGSPAVESAKKPAEIDKVGINPADLVATEPVKKPVETDKASAAPADLPAVEPAKKPAVKDAGIKKPVETGLDESNSPELNRFDERVRELMKPLETDVDGMPFEDESVRVNYDYLYDPNYVPSNNVEDAAVRNPKGVPVSEKSFNAAKKAIDNLATNSSLMQIINPERSLDSKMIINNIRSSHLTRCRLFEYLTSRLDRLAVVNPGALADRVFRDSEDNLKAPNYLGGDYYAGKMRSREYTVVLAIAMMDGSFNVGRQDETVTHYRGGKERRGMHRDSARALLEYVRNNY